MKVKINKEAAMLKDKMRFKNCLLALGLLVVLGVFIMGLSTTPVHAVVPTGYDQYLDVTAKIDGSDWFELTGNTWRWQHRYWDLPEYHGGNTPTIVNGQQFLSTWSNGTGYLAYSDYNTVVGLVPLQQVFGAQPVIWFEKLSGRGYADMVQYPSSSNNYTLRVFFDDDGYGSHDFYRFQIWGKTVSQVSEPTTMLLLGIGLLSLAGVRRKVKG